MAASTYSRAADSALAFLSERVLDDSWADQHDDVAYYFKAPLAFLESDRRADAERVLERVARYADRGGEGSANGAYAAIFQHYPWMWICWAAVRLDKKDLAEKCGDNLMKYVVPSTGAGLVAAPYSEEGAPREADLFATAEVVKVSVLLKRYAAAQLAAATLLKAWTANRQHIAGDTGRCYLRWTGEAPAQGDEVPLVLEEDVFHCIDQKTSGQLYFLLAFPAMALLEFAGTSSDGGCSDEQAKTYRETAAEMLHFLRGCSGVYESPMAHKVARAASMAGDAETAWRIADFLLSLQQPAGCFSADAEAMDAVDQTAEIVVWLRQIEQSLAQ